MGLNSRGVFSALTNLRNPSPDPACESRGEIVMMALGAGDAGAAAEILSALPEGRYNPFNCLISDGRDAHLVVYQKESKPRLFELDEGVHVIGNADAGEVATLGNVMGSKVERVSERARVAAAMPAECVLDALADICREHGSGDEPLSDTCVHVGDTYGTRSSFLLAVASPGRESESRLMYADGPPCVESYMDCTALLHELRRTSGYIATEIPTRTAS